MQYISEAIEQITEEVAATLARSAAELNNKNTGAATDFVKDSGTIILLNSLEYVISLFQNSFGYFYDTFASRPLPLGNVIGAGTGIVVWYSELDLQKYFSLYLQGMLADQDVIFIAKNLSALLGCRFHMQHYLWTPLAKRYNQRDNVKTDIQLATTFAADVKGTSIGFTSYCLVTYKI